MIPNVSLSTPPAVPAPPKRPADANTAVPVDAFTRSAEVTPADTTQALRSVQKVEKQGRSFSVSECALAPDGRLYVAYSEPKPNGPGYISATRADGALAWEAPCDGVRALRVTPDGVLHAITHSEHLRFGADGAEIGRQPLPPALTKTWIAPDGTLIGLDKEKLLVGGPADAPLDTITHFEPHGDTLRLRAEGEWVEIDGARVLQRRTVPPNEKYGNTSMDIEDVYPLPGGDTLLKIREIVEVPAPPFPSGELGHVSTGAMSQPDPEHCITRVHLRRTSPAGETRWETASLGDGVRVAVAADGSAYAAVESGGRGCLLRFGADGKRENVGPLSPPASGLAVEGDTAVVSDGNGLSVLHDGTLRPVANTSTWRVNKALGDGRVFLTDRYNKTAAVLDVATRQVTSLTAPESDPSGGPIPDVVKQADSVKPSAPPPTVIMEGGLVQIGNLSVTVDTRLP